MSSFEDRDLGWKAFKRDLEQMDEAAVKIGIQQGERNEEGQSLVDIAAYNEFGTVTIPARPFIGSTADAKQNQWYDFLSNAITQVFEQKITPYQALLQVGLLAQRDIVRRIDDRVYEENAPSTIAAKTVGGKVGDQPLVDTGQLRASIRPEVVGVAP